MGKRMNEFTKIFERVDIDNLVSYFLYGVDTFEEITDTYAERIRASYDELLSYLQERFPGTDGEDEELGNEICNFASIHDDVHIQVGIIIGFQLYKALEQGYYNPQGADIKKIIHNFAVSADNPQKTEESLLEDFFEKRISTALKAALVSGIQYQAALKKQNESISRLEKCGLSMEQKSKVDEALSASQALNTEYGREAYKQGFADAHKLLTELTHKL